MKKILLATVWLFVSSYCFAGSTNQVLFPTCIGPVSLDTVYHQLPIRLVIGTDNKTGKQKTGTIFYVGDNIWIGAAHVFSDNIDPNTIRMLTNNGQSLNIKLIHKDDKQDMAALYLPTSNVNPIRLMSAGKLPVYHRLWFAGYPMGSSPDRLVSFSGAAHRLKTPEILVSYGLVLPGMSGGPVLTCMNNQLYAVGVISQMVARTTTVDVKRKTDNSVIEKHFMINIGMNTSKVKLPKYKAVVLHTLQRL